MDDLQRLSINQLTTRDQWSLPEAADGYARAGVGAMAVWWEKLRDVGVSAASRAVRDAGLAVSGYCVAGAMGHPDPAQRAAQVDENRRLIEEAAALGARCLVAIGGGLDGGTRAIEDVRARTFDGFAELAPFAREAGVTIALEPLHPMVCATRSVLCTLAQANDWCDRLAAPDVFGIALDTYNVWWDPALADEVRRAGPRIVAYHVSDWLSDTRHLRFDRGMPGDGVIDLAAFRALVDEVGYTGHHEVEILSERWWREDPRAVVEMVKERFLSVM